MSSPDIIDHLRQSESPRLQKLAATMESNSSTVKWETVDVDVVIVGSGPIAATYARVILEKKPDTTIVMIEAGSQESPVIGGHHKNAMRYQRNPDAFVPYIKAALEPVSVPPTDPNLFPHAWQNPDQKFDTDLPAAAVSRTVGGMGSHWTCACPEPEDDERTNNPIEKSTFNGLLQRAAEFFKVSTTQYDKSIRHTVVKEVLTKECPTQSFVNIPLAVQRVERPTEDDLLIWSGVDTILGPDIKFVASKDLEQNVQLRLMTNTVARTIVSNGNSATHVLACDIENISPDREHWYVIKGKVFVAACGAIGTPQLLNMAFGRDVVHSDNPHLGAWLSEQTMAFCQVALKRSIVESIRNDPRFKEQRDDHKRHHPDDPLPIPFNDPEPQIFLKYKKENGYIGMIDRNAFFTGVRPEVDPRVVVDLRFYSKNDVQQANHMEFDWKKMDRYDMPRPLFKVNKTDADRDRENKMVKDMSDVAYALGGFVPGSEPQLMPMGLALHITGTTRIGKGKDTSLADSKSRVWDFSNLWVGGNGCIPDATAANPTLTSVAIAIYGAEAVVEFLNKQNSA
ncbi:GMC oxidoreductase [Mycena venus]|uniref:GMC oxidoreductase n=1 Tax=Mycena venus TaxID=2733690 RepID=A0A8H6YQZ4_9AGAR|nr:GMC oxidoreductase [Mycena venus]